MASKRCRVRGLLVGEPGLTVATSAACSGAGSSGSQPVEPGTALSSCQRSSTRDPSEGLVRSCTADPTWVGDSCARPIAPASVIAFSASASSASR